MNKQRLLDRFLQYVKIDTTADDESQSVPSTPGQLEMGRLLVQQMNEMGVSDVSQDKFGIVIGTVPGNSEAPIVAFNSHIDTSPDASGKNVSPHVIEDFDGKDVVLSGDPSKVITSSACAELLEAKGKTIVTTDGTTLLGGDDKAGVAIIMELANHLLENPEVKRGPVRIMFTCDEEIGRGVDHVDVGKVNATVCYNFDSGGRNLIDNETFSADLGLIKCGGVNIHPSIGKDRMVNAVRAASHFVDALPHDVSPERTDGRDGFLHPYSIVGDVSSVTIKILLRDFDSDKLRDYEALLRKTATETETAIPGSKIDVEIKKQYRNMGDGLIKEPRATSIAAKAHENLGREAELTIVRGGTDGSRLTELGLPTPNLSSGQHNIHSVLEWACLDEMVEACEVGVEIVRLWGEEK